jgi:hypothetical protein
MEGCPRIDLTRSVDALKSSFYEPQVEEVLIMVIGAMTCPDPKSVRVLVLSPANDPVVVLKLSVVEDNKALAVIESSTLGFDEEKLKNYLSSDSFVDATLLILYYEATQWVETLFLGQETADVEEKEDEFPSSLSSSGEMDLTDSRTGTASLEVALPKYFKTTLAGLAARCLGDNLLLYDGFENAPVGMKRRKNDVCSRGVIVSVVVSQVREEKCLFTW